MNSALKELIRISHLVGQDTTLVQGGGGNTSVKSSDGKHMYIKASGTALKDMDGKVGWRRVSLARALTMLDDTFLVGLETNAREAEVVNRLMLSCEDDVQTGARPSVETLLHAILEHTVIHLHPLAVGAYVNAKNGRDKLEKLFAKEKCPPLWVPYVDPGFTLARKTAQLVAAYEVEHGCKPRVILLDKHGLIVAGADPNAALRLVRKVMRTCQSKLMPLSAKKVKAPAAEDVAVTQAAIRQAFFNTTGRHVVVKHYANDVTTAFSRRRDAKQLLAAGALSPDELVYASGAPLWFESLTADRLAKKLQRMIDQGQKPAASFLVKDLGLFVASDDTTAPIVADIACGSMVIRSGAAKMGGVRALTKRERDFINNWEAESFRAKQSGSAGAGVVKDRIAVVTGAGSGLGRSIAVGLARAGALVAAADIDAAAAEETCTLIKTELPKAAAMPLRCNVTSEESVAAGFEELVGAWGGVDILVNAAGVAPAYSLVDLPVDKWRFALEVNLTGYFLMAQAAARIMIAQGIGGSIVNLSSKSGLDASKNNSPYNATKAGELHMARGWAMELGEHGIRVNCVCPGNVFEGSKIWNPTYIKVCAKKYGIRPEEVIPYYVNRTILKREIKGQDIADSVVFLCSDQARRITGQTIVTDAGQVFVR